MNNNRGSNDVNEELPDEHEVIQRSLRNNNSGKPQQDRAPVKEHKEAKASDGARLNEKVDSSSIGVLEKNPGQK